MAENQDSENVVDDTFLLDIDEANDQFSEAEDIPENPADRLKAGFSTRSEVEELVNALQTLPNGFQSSLERISLTQRLLAANTTVGTKGFTPHEPYEFRLRPITGLNQANLPEAGITLPLPPEKFDVTKSQDPRTFTAISQVEYSLPGPKLLSDIAMEGMLPFSQPERWKDFGKPNYLPQYITADNYRDPKEMIRFFDALMVAGQPVLLTISPANGEVNGKKAYGGLVGTNYVTIVGFTYGEAFGHVADFVFTLALKQWRPLYTKIKTPVTPNPVAPTAPTSSTVAGPPTPKPPTIPVPPISNPSPGHAPRPTTYTIRAGDTLWDLATRFLGTGTRWQEIYALNEDVIKQAAAARGVKDYPRGWHIFPGTKLQLPPRGLRDAS